jgi:nucleoside-diphosphate-sugar epimerase
MSRRLFVTGGTGFIGSWFVRQATLRGYEMFVLRRPGADFRIEVAEIAHSVQGSLEDIDSHFFEGIDTLVHLAAHSANFPYDTIDRCVYWNVTATLKALEKARRSGINQFLVAGTAFEYGLSGEAFDKIPPTAPLLPTMTYPASKAMAFIALNQWAIQHQVKLRYVRIFQVYGEGELSSRLYPSLKSAARAGADFNLSSGEQVRDFINVSDVAEQLAEKLNFDHVVAGSPLTENLGTGIGMTVRQFAEQHWEKFGATGKLSFGSVNYRQNEIMRLVAG